MTTDETFKVVAAASLSPVSPRPLHNTYTLPQVLPDLQHLAENPDVVPLEPTTFRTAEAAMAPEVEQTEAVQEPTQASSAASEIADLSEDGSVADDDSFQYDGEGDGENGQEQETAQVAPQEETDDYAMTFDSPADQEQMDGEDDEDEGEEQEADKESQQQHQKVVSDAPESINITEPPVQPDAAVPTQTTQPASVDSPAPNLADQGPQPDQAISAQDAPISQPFENGNGAPPAQEDVSDPAASSAISPNVKPEETASEEPTDVQPKPEDVEMTTDSTHDATSLDIQKLVDEITAKNEATEPDNKLAATSPSSTDVDMSSLPPKPALTHEQSKQTYTPTTYHHASLPNAPGFPVIGSANLPAQPVQSPQPPQPAYASNGNGAPGVTQQTPFTAVSATFASYPNAYTSASPTQQQAPGFNGNGLQQTYDDFLADERKAMAEAKWERFPEGSRIFIGNLSQERVSKRDVFELFHQHGRLAQISLKSAYGFVQYYTTAEAQSAMNGLQGAEVKGRKINLEISRTQKTKKDRDHSPERRNRNERGGRNGDRYDGGRRRDDFRGGRSPSPRRGDDHRGRQDPYSRDRGHHDSFSRKRSRSPDSYRRQDSYRHRSPSPYGRGRQDSTGDQLDIPRRYGSDVPDVQILMMQDVHKDFVDWVQRAFYEQGLRPNAMFLNPRFPREAVIQRQVLEGVHGVVELDMRAQHTAKISLQVFDRSAGTNVRFDQYQELDPPVAAQLVLRTKGSVAQPPVYPPPPPQQQQQQQHPSYPQQPYGVPAPSPYNGYPQPPMQQPQQQPQPPPTAPDLTTLVGQLSQMPNVDNNTLQTILASLQQPQAAPPPANYGAYQGQPQGGPPPPPPQVDYNALINNISAASAKNGQPPMGAGYPQPGYPQGNRGPPQPIAGSTDPARDVENIMATLARYR